jgi:hypothetical protein
MGMSGVSTLKAGPSIPSQADLGRFISRDPIGFAGGLNLFNGASTNPLTFVDPTGLDVRISYTGRSVPKVYTDAQWAEAVAALNEADRGDIRQIDFYGHGNPTCNIAGVMDSEEWLRTGGRDGDTGGVFYRNGVVQIEWRDGSGRRNNVPLKDVLGGKGVKRIRFHSCNAAGGHPDWKARLKADPKGPHLPPTERNIARFTSLELPNTFVEGTEGSYDFLFRPGNPAPGEETRTYLNGVVQP